MKLLSNIRGDIWGGVTTAVVALPLALAFGVASGAGAIAGLYGAIFLGFFEFMACCFLFFLSYNNILQNNSAYEPPFFVK